MDDELTNTQPPQTDMQVEPIQQSKEIQIIKINRYKKGRGIIIRLNVLKNTVSDKPGYLIESRHTHDFRRDDNGEPIGETNIRIAAECCDKINPLLLETNTLSGEHYNKDKDLSAFATMKLCPDHVITFAYIHNGDFFSYKHPLPASTGCYIVCIDMEKYIYNAYSRDVTKIRRPDDGPELDAYYKEIQKYYLFTLNPYNHKIE